MTGKIPIGMDWGMLDYYYSRKSGSRSSFASAFTNRN